MTAKTTADTLQLSVVINPLFTMSVHIVFENFCGRTTKRIKVFPAIFIHVHCHPMFSRSVVWIGVADDQSAHRIR